MPVTRLPVALAVNIDRIAFGRSPGHCLSLSAALMKDFVSDPFFHGMMGLGIEVGRILSFDDINVYHTHLRFASDQLDGPTPVRADRSLRLFPVLLSVSERYVAVVN